MLRIMKIHLLGAALGARSSTSAVAQDQPTENAPQTLQKLGLCEILTESGFNVENFAILKGSTGHKIERLKTLAMIAKFNERLAAQVFAIHKKKEFPIVFGGDHSIAVGTWSGIAAAHPEEDLGLLWIDAHLDSHTTARSKNDAVHGMPLASLLGHGDQRFSQILSQQPKLKGRNVCVLGVRAFETAEAELLKSFGVRVYTMNEVRNRSFEVCFYEAYKQVTKSTSRFGISLDLDVFDPNEIPAVRRPEPGGLLISEFRSCLRIAARNPHLAAFELVEYNPALDIDQSTFLKIAMFIEELLWARALGEGFPSVAATLQSSSRHFLLQ